MTHLYIDEVKNIFSCTYTFILGIFIMNGYNTYHSNCIINNVYKLNQFKFIAWLHGTC